MTLKTIRRNASKKIATVAALTTKVTVHTLDNGFDGTEREFDTVDELAEFIRIEMNDSSVKARLWIDMERNVGTLHWHSNCFANLHLGSVEGL